MDLFFLKIIAESTQKAKQSVDLSISRRRNVILRHVYSKNSEKIVDRGK
jgi:hypothetical protein